MKIAISELEHLRQEVKNCHQIIKDMQKKRPWVGLTDEDFLEACQIAEQGNYLLALQRIQIKLKEKNSD